MWLTKIFAREFGFSDVQSNYSRVYAWMANQLGHMTLGLATALFFVWIVETTYTVANEWLRFGFWNAFRHNCRADGCSEQILWSLAIVAAALGLFGFAWVWKNTRLGLLGAFLISGVAIWSSQVKCGDCWNFALLFAATLVLIGAFGGVVWTSALKPLLFVPGAETDAQRRWRRDMRVILNRRSVILSETGSAVMIALVATAGAALIVAAFPETHAEPPADLTLPFQPAADDPLMIFAATVAVAFFALACAVLCKDPRFIPVALAGLLSTFLIATDGAPLFIEAFGYAPHVIAGGFFLYSTVVIALLAKDDELFTPIERTVQILSNAIIALVLFIGMTEVQVDDWKLSLAAGVASLCVWWIKEFASDLPNVHREIASVVLKRHTADETPPTARMDETLKTDRRRALEKEYFRDARTDARTDGMFYFAGAWIGAGVLTDEPVLTDLSWSAGSEIFGLLLFVAIFVGVGKNWAYRQLALDLMGARMASRFAVFRAELRLRSLFAPGTGQIRTDALKSGAWLKHPLLKIREFAAPCTAVRGGEDTYPERECADLDDAKMQTPFHHLLVFGDLGSGRSPLGRAIASEAALADWPTRFQLKRREPVSDDADRRRARYITGARLLNYVKDIKHESDISATPTVVFSVDPVTKRAERGAREGWTREPAADVVVIDDVSIADAANPAWIGARLGNLSVADGQQTVWLIDIDDDGSASSQDLLVKAAEDAKPLLSELAKRSGGAGVDDARHFAVALTRRWPDPYA